MAKLMISNHLSRVRFPPPAPDLYHIKILRNKFDYISTTELADYFPLQLILKPRIPYADPMREDTVTPRVCFATTLAGSIGSLGLSERNSSYLGIYKPVEPMDIYNPMSRVHDAEKWGEVWSLRPVLVELQKIVMPGEMLDKRL